MDFHTCRGINYCVDCGIKLNAKNNNYWDAPPSWMSEQYDRIIKAMHRVTLEQLLLEGILIKVYNKYGNWTYVFAEKYQEATMEVDELTEKLNSINCN